MTNNEQKEILTYTLIIHQAKRKLKLTLNEYCIADSIYHLQHNPNSKVQGWCYASKKTLGNYIDITEQSAHSIISGLIKKSIIEKDQDTRYLRTTKVWYDNVILLKLNSRNLRDTKESLVSHSRKFSVGLKKVEPDTKESLDNKDNNKHINKDIIIKDTPQKFSESFFIKGKCFETLLDSFSKSLNTARENLEQEFEHFILYWTEPNKSGSKVRWELERTFDVKRRLYTWLKNKQTWAKENNKNKKWAVI